MYTVGPYGLYAVRAAPRLPCGITHDLDRMTPGKRKRARLATLAMSLVAGTALAACGESDPGYNGRPSADWIRQLDDPNPSEREFAAIALGNVVRLNPSYSPAVHALIRALGDTADKVRVSAASALAREGVRAPDAVPGLIVVLGDSAHADVRAHGARVLGAVLGQFGSRRRRSDVAADSVAYTRGVEALVSATSDRDASVRIAAAQGLGRLGPRGAAASTRLRPTLAALVTSPNPELRVAALEGYANSGAAPALVTRITRSTLADSQPAVRLAAVKVLEHLGPSAKPAIPDLVRTLADGDAFIRSASASAIGEIGPELATDALKRATRDPVASVRQEAAHALEGYHRKGREDPPPAEPGLGPR